MSVHYIKGGNIVENNVTETSDHLSGLRTFWQERIPEHADTIMKVLTPFCNSDCSLDLKIPVEGLAELCKKAIFWQEIAGVKIIHEDDSFDNSFEYALVDNINLDENLEDIILEGMELSFSCNPEGDFWMYLNFLLTLSYTCSFAILNDKENDFQAIWKLWCLGNMPIGFDKDGNLLVLCANYTAYQASLRQLYGLSSL